MHRILAALLICALVGFTTTFARAAIVTHDLSIEYSGATPPAGAAPWLRATFDDGGASGSVTLTLSAPNLLSDEHVFVWMFNLDPSLDPTALQFSAPLKTGTFSSPAVSTGVDAFHAAGDGLYDIEVEFDNAGPETWFGPTHSVQYTITGIPTLTANSFDFLSAPAGGNGPFPTAAHVLGIGPTSDLSGWISVPEPAAMSLLSAALLPLSRRFRRR